MRKNSQENSPVFNLDEWIKVRGIPVRRWEIIQHEQEFGAQLFDEINFPLTKRKDVANVITALDKQLRVMQELKGDPKYYPDPKEGESVDIGDKGWLYFPVLFGDPDGTIVMMRSKKFPAGPVGWFRFKRWFVT